jgi:hypothetical protein
LGAFPSRLLPIGSPKRIRAQSSIDLDRKFLGWRQGGVLTATAALAWMGDERDTVEAARNPVKNIDDQMLEAPKRFVNVTQS